MHCVLRWLFFFRSQDHIDRAVASCEQAAFEPDPKVILRVVEHFTKSGGGVPQARTSEADETAEAASTGEHLNKGLRAHARVIGSVGKQSGRALKLQDRLPLSAEHELAKNLPE